jgi:hypothetical protein
MMLMPMLFGDIQALSAEGLDTPGDLDFAAVDPAALGGLDSAVAGRRNPLRSDQAARGLAGVRASIAAGLTREASAAETSEAGNGSEARLLKIISRGARGMEGPDSL